MMRRAEFPSDAAYYRAHRAAFELALHLGITPREAEAEIRRRKAMEAIAALKARKEMIRLQRSASHGAAIAHDPTPPPPSPSDWDAPYMMRN